LPAKSVVGIEEKGTPCRFFIGENVMEPALPIVTVPRFVGRSLPIVTGTLHRGEDTLPAAGEGDVGSACPKANAGAASRIVKDMQKAIDSAAGTLDTFAGVRGERKRIVTVLGKCGWTIYGPDLAEANLRRGLSSMGCG
jgi:hypothetical protein